MRLLEKCENANEVYITTGYVQHVISMTVKSNTHTTLFFGSLISAHTHLERNIAHVDVLGTAPHCPVPEKSWPEY